MAKDKSNNSEYQIPYDFNEKYRTELDKIATVEGDRWDELRKLKIRDNFILDLMQVYSPKGYVNIVEQDINTTKNPDLGIASYRRKYDEKGRKIDDFDPDIFTLAVKQAVTEWKQDSNCTFTQLTIEKYKRMAGDASADEFIGTSGIADTEKRNRHLKTREERAVRDIRKYRSETGTDESVTDSISKVLGANGMLGKFSEKSLERIENMISQINIAESLDAPISEDNKEVPRKELLADSSDPFHEILAENHMPDDDVFYAGWEKLLSMSNLRTREIIKLFFSRSILVELKLYLLTEEQRKTQDNTDLEPGCNSWCPTAKQCTKDKNHRKCYIRYNRIQGDIFPKELDERFLTGNWYIYKKLNEAPKTFYAILNNDYAKMAYKEKPRRLYDFYSGVLKDFDGEENEQFKFTDEYMSKSMGVSQSTITRAKEKFAEAQDMFFEIMFEGE